MSMNKTLIRVADSGGGNNNMKQKRQKTKTKLTSNLNFHHQKQQYIQMMEEKIMKPPCDYEELYSSYILEWKQQQNQNNKTNPYVEINDILIGPQDNPRWIAAVTNLGQVVVVIMNISSDDVDHDEDSSKQDSSCCSKNEVIRVIDVSTEPLQTIALISDDIKTPKLVVGGVGGIWILNAFWHDDYKSSIIQQKPPTQILPIPIQEIQITKTEEDTAKTVIIIYALTENDGQILQCVYKTSDTDDNPTTTTNKIYKNSMKPATTFRLYKDIITNATSYLVIGTSVSEVLWLDINKGKIVETLSLTEALGSSSANKKQHNNNHRHKQQQQQKSTTATNINYKVTSMWLTNDQWWTISGARTTTSTSSSSNNSNTIVGGFLCTWHRPTKSMIAYVDTRETIQRILGIDPPPPNESSSSSSSPSLLLYTLGNESFLSVWNSPYQLQRTYRIAIHSPSGKAMAVVSSSSAVGGDNVSLPSLSSPLGQKQQTKSSSNNTAKNQYLWVAGIGCKINVIQDHCCIKTLDILKNNENENENE